MTPEEINFRKVAPPYMHLLMKDFDFDKLDAAAIFGNAGYESKGLTDDQEDKPVVRGSRGGLNWFQWTGPRRVAMEAYCKRNGLSPTSDEAAYKWLFVELSTTEQGAVGKVKIADTLDDKVIAFEKAFERAGVKSYERRKKWARIALEAYDEWLATRVPDEPEKGPTGATKGSWVLYLVSILIKLFRMIFWR